MRASTAATPSMAAIGGAATSGRARAGEHVAETVALVVGGAGLLERTIRADGKIEGGHAAGHDQGDGQRLRPQRREIADELPVERAHGASPIDLGGLLRVAFTVVSMMRPSQK